MLWIGEVEDAKSTDDLVTSASVNGDHDFNKICGNNEAILDFRESPQVQLKNDNVQAFDTKWDEVLSAVTDRPTESISECLYMMHIYNVGRK